MEKRVASNFVGYLSISILCKNNVRTQNDHPMAFVVSKIVSSKNYIKTKTTTPPPPFIHIVFAHYYHKNRSTDHTIKIEREPPLPPVLRSLYDEPERRPQVFPPPRPLRPPPLRLFEPR